MSDIMEATQKRKRKKNNKIVNYKVVSTGSEANEES